MSSERTLSVLNVRLGGGTGRFVGGGDAGWCSPSLVFLLPRDIVLSELNVRFGGGTGLAGGAGAYTLERGDAAGTYTLERGDAAGEYVDRMGGCAIRPMTISSSSFSATVGSAV